MHDRSQINKKTSTVLEIAFEVTMRYYLESVDVTGRTLAVALEKAWSNCPTIEAALRGVNCLLTYDAKPTSCELVSLAFLSLALLGISLDTSDLAIAVRILHHQAQSWSSLIPVKQDRIWFEDLLNDLWLLAEQDQYYSRLHVVAHEHSFGAESASFPLTDSNDFVIQIAQIFIHCESSLRSD